MTDKRAAVHMQAVPLRGEKGWEGAVDILVGRIDESADAIEYRNVTMQLLINYILEEPRRIYTLERRDFERIVIYALFVAGYRESYRQQHDVGLEVFLIEPGGQSQIRLLIHSSGSEFDAKPGAIQSLLRLATPDRQVRRSWIVAETPLGYSRDWERDGVEFISLWRVLNWLSNARSLGDEYASTRANRIRQLTPANSFGAVHLDEISSTSVADIERSLRLPDDYYKRLVQVEHLPLYVAKRVAADPHTLHALTPRQFEEFTAGILEGIGFSNIVLTPTSRDGGRDVIASNVVHGIPITFFFECKKYAADNAVQIQTLRTLLGVVAHESRTANIGVLVTTSRFTRGCRDFIAAECRLDGKDYDGLLGWIDAFRSLHSP